MSEQLFKVGEKYKTRDGHDAVVYAYYSGQGYCYHGAVFNTNYARGEWSGQDWRRDGNRYADETTKLDLMLPEKKKKLYAFKVLHPNGYFHIYSSSPDCTLERAPQFDCYVEVEK